MIDDLIAELIDLQTLTDMAVTNDTMDSYAATSRIVNRELGRIIAKLEKESQTNG